MQQHFLIMFKNQENSTNTVFGKDSIEPKKSKKSTAKRLPKLFGDQIALESLDKLSECFEAEPVKILISEDEATERFERIVKAAFGRGVSKKRMRELAAQCGFSISAAVVNAALAKTLKIGLGDQVLRTPQQDDVSCLDNYNERYREAGESTGENEVSKTALKEASLPSASNQQAGSSISNDANRQARQVSTNRGFAGLRQPGKSEHFPSRANSLSIPSKGASKTSGGT